MLYLHQFVLNSQLIYIINIEVAMFPYYSDTPSPAPAWDSGLMYYQNNLNPYDSEQFLNQTFNFNQQSIAAFQTLPHQLKLKFYLSVEEVKMLGHMNDRQGYQNILQEIARRRMIIKKPEIKKQKNQAEQWGAKLENLCEDHLKKMQKDNFLQDLPIGYYETHSANTRKIDLITDQNLMYSGNNTSKDEQFDWVEPDPIQQNASKNLNHSQNSQSFQYFDYGKGLHVQENQNKLKINNEVKKQQDEFDDFVEANVQNVQKSQSLPAMQNSLENKNTLISYNSLNQVQPPQKQQHIDIWDLQVIQEDPDKLKKIILNKASISQSSQKKSSLQPEPNLSSVSNIPHISSQKQYPTLQNQQSLASQSNISTNKDNLYPVVSSHVIGYNLGSKNQNNLFSLQPIDFNEPKHIQEDEFLEMPASENEAKNGEHRAETQNSTKRNDQDQFQWQQNGKTDELETVFPIINVNQQTSKVHNNQLQVQQFQNGNQFNFLQAPQQQYQNIFYSDKTYSSKQTPQKNSNDNQNSSSSTPYMETSFGIDLKSFENSFSLGEITHQPQADGEIFNDQASHFDYFKKKQNATQIQNQMQSSMLASSLLPSVDTQMLDPLKRFPPTENIVSALKKKGFDFDRAFYKQAQNLISNLGYQNNPDYEYLREQGKICDQIFRLTEAYTAAVDQDKENQIKQNLKKCKTLYSQLDTAKTVSTVKKYLKMQGKGLQYQIGRLSLEAGVPKQLLSKYINDPKFNQVATLFYLMVFFGSIYSTSTLACQVIDYMEQIYDQMQKLGQQISEMPTPCKKIIKQNQKFLMYRQNLAQISTLIRRFVLLGTLSSKDQLYYDMASIQQKIDSLPHEKKKTQKQQLIPNYFVTFFSELASSKCNNIYTLHSQMGEFIDDHPLCALCLECLESDRHDECGGAKREDGKFYHFKCWNFKNEILKFKRQQMSSSGTQ